MIARQLRDALQRQAAEERRVEEAVAEREYEMDQYEKGKKKRAEQVCSTAGCLYPGGVLCLRALQAMKEQMEQHANQIIRRKREKKLELEREKAFLEMYHQEAEDYRAEQVREREERRRKAKELAMYHKAQMVHALGACCARVC